MKRRLWIFFRLAVHFGVLSVILFSLVAYSPGSRLMIPEVRGAERAPATAEVVDSVTIGELKRRVERVEGIGLERRLAQLETRVEANSTLLWTALFGLGALVLETFGRVGVMLVGKARSQAG